MANQTPSALCMHCLKLLVLDEGRNQANQTPSALCMHRVKLLVPLIFFVALLVAASLGTARPRGVTQGLELRLQLRNVKRHPRSYEVIRGHPRSSEVIRGHQRPSEVIRGHQRSSEAITCSSEKSEARCSSSSRSFLFSLCSSAFRT